MQHIRGIDLQVEVERDVVFFPRPSIFRFKQLQKYSHVDVHALLDD